MVSAKPMKFENASFMGHENQFMAFSWLFHDVGFSSVTVVNSGTIIIIIIIIVIIIIIIIIVITITIIVIIIIIILIILLIIIMQLQRPPPTPCCGQRRKQARPQCTGTWTACKNNN